MGLSEIKSAAGHKVHEGEADSVAWFDGGRSHVGTARPEHEADGEGPERPVKLQPFGIAKRTVTNAEFAAFVRQTGYATEAEAYGWSFVFAGLLPESRAQRAPETPWWLAVDGALWSAPLGPDGPSWEDAPDHPVVHVSHTDATAYATWAGARLPSEAEWEHAARGGPAPARYPWGDEEPNDDDFMPCNIWQGRFPTSNTCKDGFYGAAPAESFAPNSAGLFNMSGNVWEWCAEPFRIASVKKAAKARNAEARQQNARVMKGGSFLCHRSYCWRYRIAARMGRQADNASVHAGFRLAFDPS